VLDESGMVYEVYVTEELGSSVTLVFGERRAWRAPWRSKDGVAVVQLANLYPKYTDTPSFRGYALHKIFQLSRFERFPP
jgi:hypothetical protein